MAIPSKNDVAVGEEFQHESRTAICTYHAPDPSTKIAYEFVAEEVSAGVADISSNTAADLTFTPAQDITATTTRDAILELDSELTVVENEVISINATPNLQILFENALV